VLCHRTGVDDVYVGRLGRRYYCIASGCELPLQGRCLGVVQLAAKGVESDGSVHIAKVIKLVCLNWSW